MLSESQANAFKYLRARAEDGGEFTVADLEKVAGWQKSTFDTFKTKHLKPYVVSAGTRGSFRVKPHFLRMTEEEFEDIVSQTRRSVAEFTRTVYGGVLEYEFLLPLTNERRLRGALDELFYRDHLVQRAREIGVEALRLVVPAESGESEESYLEGVAQRVGVLLGGYSIAHVNGRFRAGSLRSHAEAAEVLARRGRYLVDETTAVVRFLLPLQITRVPHGESFDIASERERADVSMHEEAETARKLFIAFFVENVILSIHAEDEIWFLERSHAGTRLYVLERAVTKTAAKPRDAASHPQPKEQLALSGVAPQPSSLESWLQENGYSDVASKIEQVVLEWRKQGLKTRRNWWDVLAGDRAGKHREVAGVAFPIIASIRSRQGLPPISGALAHDGETPLPSKQG